MWKILKKLLIFLLAIVIYKGCNYGYGMIRIGAGLNAKTLCSCVFVSGRSEQSVHDQELSRELTSFLNNTLDREGQSATSGYLGINRKAIYRPGYGCTLISELDEETIRNQPLPAISSDLFVTSDTLLWPYGSMDTLPIPANVDLAKIQEAFDYAFEEPDLTNLRRSRAALVVYKGKIIKEQYADGIDQDMPLLGWSMAKSITNSLVGLLTLDGRLDVDALADVPEWHTDAKDPRSSIKLDDLMHMSSGLDFEEDYGSVSQVNQMLWTKASAGTTAATSKLKHDINTHWYYSSGTTNIISRIIRDQFTDDAAYHLYPHKRLFGPLGMKSATMEMDASGTYVGSSFVHATARDWAKWGMLYLHDGIWNGKRILPEGWVDYSSTRTPALEGGYYSAQFWNNGHAVTTAEGKPIPEHWPNVPEDAYYATGFEGQIVLIIPSLELVIVRLGYTADDAMWDASIFAERVVAAVRG